MKFNFGTGIAIFYTIFAATMVYFVFKSTQYDHSLVREDYYKGDLEYQQHYNKLYNTKMLDGEIVVQHQSDKKRLLLSFPEELEKINGNATFFRPSNSGQDIQVALATDENLRQSISTASLQSGRWKIKLDWTSNGKPYYKEIDLVL
ncbi:MAG: FixH family protein [Bacteroidota bacterium]